MADNDEEPCSILQANSEYNRNNDRIISRKRRLKTNYYPPSKRARVDCSDVQHNNGDKSSNVTNDGGNLHGNPRDTSITKSGSNHKRSNRSKNCKRYRRPMIRLLTGKTKHRLNGKPPPSKLDARFKELIAQGAVSHILRECRLKAVLRECRQKAVARKNAEEVDSLYGYGDETLHFPARTFGGSVLSSKDETFKSSMIPKVGPNSLAHSRRTNPPLVHLEEEHEMPKDATDEEFLKGKTKMKSQCKTRVVKEIEEDVLPVSRENTNDHNPPPSTEKVDSPNEDSEPNFPSNNADPNRRYLPFDFMSGTSNAASTPRGKITRVFTASHGTSTSRIKVSNRGLRKSIGSAAANTCVYTNDYSPIRPRLSRGPIMAPFDTSSFSLREPPISSANNVQEIPITPVRNPAKSKSLPFNFMSGDDPTKESNTNFPRTGMAAPHGNIVSIVKYIISVAANWLLSWRSMPQGNGVHSNHSSPISSTSPISSSPRGSMNNSLLGSVTERSTTTTRPLPYRREFSVSSRGRDSSLPLPPASNRAFLSTNDRPPYVPLNEPKFGGDTASNNTSSSGQRTNNGYNVKNRTDTAPPRGWESFFQPKVGEWKCEVCFYINPAEAMTCDSCTALNRRTDDLNVVDLDVFVDDDDLNVVDLNVFEDEASGYDDGTTSKRIKVNSADDLNSDGNAAKSVIGHPPDRTEKRSQNRGTSSGKRIKVDRAQGLKGDGIAPDAMSTDSPDTSGSKKRNKSDEDNDEVNHSSKAARAQDGSQMAMEDANLLELMDIESPSR